MAGNINLETKNIFGVDDAKKRIDDGWAQLKNDYLDKVAVASADMEWQGDTAHFKVRALGQEASAALAVTQEDLKLDIALPWLLAGFAPVIETIIKDRAIKALNEKKPNGAA